MVSTLDGQANDKQSDDPAIPDKPSAEAPPVTDYSALFEAAPYGMLLADHAGKITRTNARLDAMFGYDAGELIGQPVELLLPERRRESQALSRERFFSHPEQRAIGIGTDLTALQKSGTEFPMEIGYCSVTTPEGPHTGAWVIDITDRKRSELRLRMANAQLQEFMRVAAHDLRAPLRAIGTLVNAIAEDEAMPPDEARRGLRRAADRVAGIERLVDDLLVYASAGRRSGPIERIDLGALIDQAIALESPGAFVSIDVSVPKETFEGARTSLATVIRNLLSNAIRHHDREHIKIAIHARLEGNHCMIDVVDDGPGIPEAEQHRVFRLFQTLADGDERGSGVGLAVVKRLVEGHGGSISVTSRDGERGCRFRVWWPRYLRSDLND